MLSFKPLSCGVDHYVTTSRNHSLNGQNSCTANEKLLFSAYYRLFFDRAKKLKDEKLKTQGKNSKLKQKTQEFGKCWCNLLQK